MILTLSFDFSLKVPLYTLRERYTVVGEKNIYKDVVFYEIPLLDTLILGQVRIISYFWFCGQNTVKEYALLRDM